MVKRRAFIVLLLGAALLEAAGYVAFPFIALRLRDHFHLSLASIGVVMSVAICLRPVVSLAGGWLSERVHGKWLLAVACLLEAVGFLLLSLASSPVLAIAGLIVGNVGFSVWTPNLFAMASLAGESEAELKRISLINGFINFGAAAGCVAGGLLASMNPMIVFLVAGLMYLCLLPILFPFAAALALDPAKSGGEQASKKVNLSKIPRGSLVATSILSLMFWANYGQFNGYFAMYTSDWLGSTEIAGASFAALAILVAIFSSLMARLPAASANLSRLVALSLTLLIGGWAALTNMPGLAAVVIFIPSLALGETVHSIFLAERWNRLFPRSVGWAQGVNFALRSAAMGFGGLVGGLVYQKPEANADLSNWFLVNVVMLVLAMASVSKWSVPVASPEGLRAEEAVK